LNNNLSSNIPNEKKKSISWIRIIVFIVVIIVSLYIFTIPEQQLLNLKNYGYPGIFILSIISNATVLIPAPGLLIVFSLGARLNPLLVGIIAGLGSALGELSGYLLGYSGQALVEDREAYNRMLVWMEKNGPATILLLAFVPNPIFDLTGIVAGILKMPIMSFLFWTSIGKILKMSLIAFSGAGVIKVKFW